MHRSQHGITGLETAIILIAFVVVAAVFAYTVLSAGLFSTQKSQEAVYAGLSEAQCTIEPRGDVVAYKGDATISDSVGKVEFSISLSGDSDESVDLTPPYILAAGVPTDSGFSNPTVIAFTNEAATEDDCAWTLSWTGKHTEDYLLENGEKAIITVWLHDYDGANWATTGAPFLGTTYVEENDTFTLEVKPPKGAVLNVTRNCPAYLDSVMNLH